MSSFTVLPLMNAPGGVALKRGWHLFQSKGNELHFILNHWSCLQDENEILNLTFNKPKDENM